jgi:signal transduction histidine kinase
MQCVASIALQGSLSTRSGKGKTGAVSINVFCLRAATVVSVEVANSGIGIDPGIIEKIFVPFEQGDKDIVKQFGGLELGLAITKAVIDVHGGAIAVQSAGVDLGAAFTIRLRLAGEPGISGNVVEK